MWLNDIAPSLYEALDFIPNVKEKVFRLSKDQNWGSWNSEKQPRKFYCYYLWTTFLKGS
jgi:hypothetical protein